jgi:predicted nucleic acid-binding Zn finger protein
MTKTSITTNATLVAPVDAKMHVGVWRKKAAYPRYDPKNTTLTQYFGKIGKFTDIVQEQMRIMEPRTDAGFPCVTDKCNNIALRGKHECRKCLGVDTRAMTDDEFDALEMAEQARREYKMEQDAENEYESSLCDRADASMNEAAFEAQQYCMNEAEDDDEGETKAYKMQRDAENDEAYEAAFEADIDIKRAKDDDDYSDYDVFFNQ